MKKYAKILILLLVITAIIIGAITLIHHRKAELSMLALPQKKPKAVETATIKKGTLALYRHFLGLIKPVEVAEIATRTEGYLIQVHKEIGDQVAAGERVAEIKNRLVNKNRQAAASRLRGAKDELSLWEKELKRRQKLFKEGHISEDKLDDSKRIYKITRARVGQLQAELEGLTVSESFTQLSAPFSGIVSERYHDKGDLVMPGQAVYRLENPGAGYKVLADIPHTFQAQVKPGDRVMIINADRQTEAKVNRIHPAVHKGNLSTAEIRVPGTPFGLPSGAVVGLDIYYADIAGLIVPTASLLNGRNQSWVFRLEEHGKIGKYPVVVLGHKDELSVIKGPLADGDVVVIGRESMLLQLNDGDVVNPTGGTTQ